MQAGPFREFGPAFGIVGGAFLLWWLLIAAAFLALRVLVIYDVPHDPELIWAVVRSPGVLLVCLLAQVADVAASLMRESGSGDLA